MLTNFTVRSGYIHLGDAYLVTVGTYGYEISSMSYTAIGIYSLRISIAEINVSRNTGRTNAFPLRCLAD